MLIRAMLRQADRRTDRQIGLVCLNIHYVDECRNRIQQNMSSGRSCFLCLSDKRIEAVDAQRRSTVTDV